MKEKIIPYPPRGGDGDSGPQRILDTLMHDEYHEGLEDGITMCLQFMEGWLEEVHYIAPETLPDLDDVLDYGEMMAEEFEDDDSQTEGD